MRLPNVVFEWKISVGQVILAIIFILGTTVTLGKTLNDIADAKEHAKLAMPRSEVESRLTSIDDNIKALRELVYTHVTRTGFASSAPSDTGKGTRRRQ